MVAGNSLAKPTFSATEQASLVNPLHQRPRRPHDPAQDHGVLGERHRLTVRVIAFEPPAVVADFRRPLRHHPLRRPQHEDLPVPPARPAAVDQDRASRRERGRHGLALHPEHSALGRVEAEALQPVAAEPHDAGPRYQVPGASRPAAPLRNSGKSAQDRAIRERRPRSLFAWYLSASAATTVAKSGSSARAKAISSAGLRGWATGAGARADNGGLAVI